MNSLRVNKYLRLVYSKIFTIHAFCLLSFAYFTFWFQPLGVARPATHWMGIYDAQDFSSFASVLSFVASLKVPIPPNLALLENLVHLYTGSYYLVCYWLYLIFFFVAYAVAIYLGRASRIATLSTTALAVFFWHMTFVIHPGNPQLYDAALPALLVGYILFYYLVLTDLDRKYAAVYCLLAGFCLAQAELTRPFVLYLLPVLLAFPGLTLRRKPKLLLCLISPLVLITLPWHAHQLINHKQLIASNHVGFNLARAWGVVAPMPALIPEIHNQPIAPQRGANMNTSEHSENSNLLKKAVFKYWVNNPVQFSAQAVKAIWYFWSGPGDTYGYVATSRWLGVYRFTVRSLGILAVVVFLFELFRACRGVGVYNVQHQVNLLISSVILMISFIYSVGEHGEESRFLISLLPLFACLLPAVLVTLRRSKSGASPYRTRPIDESKSLLLSGSSS